MDGLTYRHEFKYIISDNQYFILQNRLKHFMPIDKHVNDTGKYLISSLYFDDYANSCYRDNLAGTDPREKFRVRIYNNDTNRITLECKRKEKGKVLKKSSVITKEQFMVLMKKERITDIEDYPVVMKKLVERILDFHMHPVVIVEYERVPFVYNPGNVRITLDSNLASSNKIDSFLEGVKIKRPVMPMGCKLLEVKYDSFLPDSIYKMLQLDHLQQTAFSKYSLCRRFSISTK